MDSVNIEVLFSAAQIAERVRGMGREITEYYRGRDVTVIALTNGAMPFAADLMRCMDLPLFVDTLSVASYHQDKRGDMLEFRSTLKLSPQGRHVLLLDEVLDSGRTMKGVVEYLKGQGAADIKTAVMIVKDVDRTGLGGVTSVDWFGFTSPDAYLVGYGLDSHELYRNLPYIGVIR